MFTYLQKWLLDCLFPQNCYGCGRGSTWLCPACFRRLLAYQGERPRALGNTADLVIAGEYRDPLLARLITAFKFDGNRDLVRSLSAFLIAALDKRRMIDHLAGKEWHAPLVIPVPLSRRRQRQRGFNQSALLAQEVAAYYNYPFNNDLFKIKKTAVQATLNEAQRLKNQAGAYCWRGQDIAGKNILLIDDITTSGATLAAATIALQEAGAGRIITAAIAKG